MSKLFFCASLLFLSHLLVAQINTPTGATVPFGSNATYAYGIKPTNLPTGSTYGGAQDAANAYNAWKTNYVELCAGSPTKYRVRFDNPSETVSEGIAYGMILAAYAADKNLFDGLWQYYKSFRNANGVMNWKISGCSSVIGTGGATDAELDAAIALRVAMAQWPSVTTYATDLNALLVAIRTYELQASTAQGPYQTNNGDAWGQSNPCRNPSYQSPAYYKAFGLYETNQTTLWSNAENASYTLLNANVNASTGLVSNWCDPSGTPNSCNGANDYGWDACRFPWRMATAVTWWNTPAAVSRCNALAAYVNSTGVSNLRGPVAQGGGSGAYHSPAFVSTWACGLMGAGATYQATLNAAYTETVNTQDALPYYFGNTLRVLALFQMTGNFWNPATVNTSNPCTGSTLSVSAGTNATICAGTSISRTALAVGGAGAYTYLWSNGSTTATQSFTPTTTSTYSVTATDANGCNAISAVTISVNALPTVNAGADVSLCNGATATLTASGANTYLWNMGATAASITVSPTTTTTYTVTGTNANGCTATDAVVVTVSNAGTPAAPSSVAASDGTSTTSVNITWTSSPCYYYQIYRNTTNNSNTATALNTTWVSGAAYQDATAVAGTLYYYWVKAATATTGTNASAFSTSNSGYRALPAPTGVSATDGTSSTQVQITWTNVSGLYYRIYRNTTNNSATATALGTAWTTGSSYNDGTAVAGTTYYYWVKASQYSTGTPASAFSTADTGFRGIAPTVPTNVNATDGTYTDRVYISWTGTTGAYYQVYRNTANSTSGATALNTTWTSATNYNDYSAVAGTTYYYWVKAASSASGTGATAYSTSNTGFSANSSGGTGTTPNNASASDGAYSDRVRITWGGNGVNYFMVYRNSTNNSATATPLFTTWISSMFYDDMTVTPGTTYYYWVKAATSASGTGASAFSNGDPGYAYTLLSPDNRNRLENSILGIDRHQVHITPNPIQDAFALTWYSEMESNWKMRFYDLKGSLLYENTLASSAGYNTQTIILPQLSVGLYWIGLEGEGKVLRTQVIVR